jgi:CBS-domain-containing membrane protein
MALLRGLRSLLLGETWAIPLGVAAILLVAAALRSELATHVWREDGGFVVAALVAVTLLASLRCELFARRSPRRR